MNTQREIIEKPFNRFLKHVTQYYGYTDTVQLRWSGAGLTNRTTLANILATGLQSGFVSQQKAVEAFNYDDDTAQIAEEMQRIEKDKSSRQSMFGANGGMSSLFGLGDEH